MILAENVSKTVSTSDIQLSILEGIDLEIKSGECVVITGTSGSGKSTLLGLLAGLDLPSAGSVIIDGVDISELDEDQRAALRGEKVGFVFQSFQLLPGLSALENVMLPAELKGQSNAREDASSLLAKVGLAERASHYPRQLSGGEQQRVAIARAFSCQPQILFADEPTGNLDSKTGAQIIDLLFQLNQDAGTTLVLVTHDENLAKLCDRRIRIEAGKLLSGSEVESEISAGDQSEQESGLC